MPRQKILSAKQLIRILEQFGFEIYSQRGSHIKLHRFGHDGQNQTIMVPNHYEIDRGTLRKIYKQILAFIPAERLQSHFFNY